MLELDSPLAKSWIAARLSLDPDHLHVESLGGGVSNHVLLVRAPGLHCVFKQSLERLRVEQEWLCRRDRIFRESQIMRDLAGLLPPGSVPAILLEDRENFLFAMEAAPEEAQPWKTPLLQGEVNLDLAARAGNLLGTWIRESGRHPQWRSDYGDQTVFHELRVDPYYRSTAARHPHLADHFAALIQESAQRNVSLVHGDFSPKNLLVTGQSMMTIDWEVVHWGDPSFDAAFLTNHLLLKAFHRRESRSAYAAAASAFWSALLETTGPEHPWLESAAMRHLGCLLLARVDGKSPAEYLTTESVRDQVRDAARQLILTPPASAAGAFERVFS
ncbi:phosphotransferase family protein [Paludibaculum fermentans]|uniref:Aminoglycoside phosphotransferase family protein n=1 Tax=Paludibaculum fermentans TaxID=1473598 RepID=A0A7S7NK01_PALFE|nr:phosphotransferase [Paludibaculum fermentans]QOY85038.1 aminoglycoside phosphotransferase family protein [Paludibaculum fermentans]